MHFQMKLIFYFILIWNCNFFKLCNCINILGIVTSPLKSNHYYASTIFNDLAINGHSVRVLSPHPQSQKIHHLFLDGLEKYKFDTQNSLWHNSNNNGNSYFSKTFHQYHNGLDRTQAIMQHKSFKKLLTSSYTVDIIIIDYDYNEALLGLAKFFNCPVIVLYYGEMNGSIRNLINLSYPFRFLNFHDNNVKSSNNFPLLNLIKRSIYHCIEDLFINFYYHPSQKSLYENIFTDKIIRTHTATIATTMSFDEIREISIAKFFINTPSLSGNLQLNDIVDVTEFHIPSSSTLSSNQHYYFNDDNNNSNSNSNHNNLTENLDNFIHSSNDGCIYVSLGANINPNLHLPNDKILTIFRALQQRSEKILWSWNGNISVYENYSNQFFIQKTLPQNEILKHSNIKLFITSGGTLSLIEAIYHEIPVIGIPITQQQSDMMDLIVNYGLGIKLDPQEFSKASLTSAISDIIENERYRDNLYKKSQQIHDRPLTPMKTVKYWIEYVYRQRNLYKTYNQILHNYPRISNQEIYQNLHKFNNLKSYTPLHLEYYFLNVYLISLIILVITVIATKIIVKFIYNLIYVLMARQKLKTY